MKTYTAVVASDSFVDMLKHGNAHRMKLSMLCEAILRSKQAASDADQDAIFSDSSDPLLQAAAAIVYLLQPLPLQGLESVATAEKVAMTLKGTSKSPVLSYVKGLLPRALLGRFVERGHDKGDDDVGKCPED